MIVLKRAYEPPDARDGRRVLVERLWPRGVKKENLKLDGWLKNVAPSTQLRQWFAHDPEKWPEFQRRYRAELRQHAPDLAPLVSQARRGRLTLVYSSHDAEHNNAVVLKQLLDEKLQRSA